MRVQLHLPALHLSGALTRPSLFYSLNIQAHNPHQSSTSESSTKNTDKGLAYFHFSVKPFPPVSQPVSVSLLTLPANPWDSSWVLNGQVYSLCQQVHQVARCGGVRSEWGSHHMTGGMAPALVPIMGAIGAETGSNRRPKDHLAWSRTKSVSEASFVDKLTPG